MIEQFQFQPRLIILGHLDFLQTMQDGTLAIGCEVHTFDEWREIADGLGAKEGQLEVLVKSSSVAIFANGSWRRFWVEIPMVSKELQPEEVVMKGNEEPES